MVASYAHTPVLTTVALVARTGSGRRVLRQSPIEQLGRPCLTVVVDALVIGATGNLSHPNALVLAPPTLWEPHVVDLSVALRPNVRAALAGPAAARQRAPAVAQRRRRCAWVSRRRLPAG